MTQPLIQPRTLKGFRDFLPAVMMPREQLLDTARRVYRSFGFAPIDTPTLELSEILCGKGSEETDRQMYRFEHGRHDVAMRFDLTVPLARFVAQHQHELGMPFKRYHLANVWRGENPQAGRFREFVQCDFDTVGTTSIASDIETVLVIDTLFHELGFEKFSIRLNNRKVLNGILQQAGLAEHSVAVLRSLDKLPKIGPEKVRQEMLEQTGAPAQAIDQVLQLAELTGSSQQVLQQLGPLCSGELAQQGRDELAQVVSAAAAVGLGPERLSIDVSIARGLDYYTGTIVETFLDDLPNFGSMCSGGRYDHLAQLYTRTELPGIGASLGLDRLLAAMQELNMLPEVTTPAEVLIVQFDEERLHDYLRIAHQLRSQGLAVEVYPEPRKLNRQFKYADRRGHRAVLVAGSEELAQGVVQIKWMPDGSQTEVPLDDQSTAIGQWLADRLGQASA